MTISLFYSDKYIADIGSHIMPIHKFRLVRDAIVASQLPMSLHQPDPISEEDLLRVHTKDYIEAIKTGAPKLLAESQKFPWSPGLAEAVRYTNGGCLASLDAALQQQISGNLASGFHHSHADHGEGFCTFNGLILALERAYQRRQITRGLVIDLDLHYGNGTASLITNRPYCANLSIYGSWYKQNVAYQDVETERVADTNNAWSVPVPNGANGDHYLSLIKEHTNRVLDAYQPEVILYQAGADPYREDPYSPLDVGLDALYERDHLIFSMARARKIPISYVLAGGYTKDLSKIVEVHLNTFKAAVAVFG
jgi:acetoin utilization deacetylase AcuC-like enzyme